MTCSLDVTAQKTISVKPCVGNIRKHTPPITRFSLMRQRDLCFLHEIIKASVTPVSASSAWLGFTTAHDRQRIDAFIGRSKRTGFCATDLDDFDTLCTSADNQLFLKVLHNPDHVLHSLLPPPNGQNYNLRRRTHNIQTTNRFIWSKITAS